ncbi:MAG TPA: hypothetical protein VMU59_14415 [Caulobacteraceae bacterium]|nr:hypothetical protein [Caulobacteraceae bacterium]
MIGLALFAVLAATVPAASQCGGVDDQSPEPLCRKIAELGKFESAKFGPQVAGVQTIEAFYQREWGTGFHNQSVALLQADHGQFRVLWTHESISAGADPFNANSDEATVFRWKVSPDGAEIVVTGTHTLGHVTDLWTGKAVGRTQSLPSERYCFQPKARVFSECR